LNSGPDADIRPGNALPIYRIPWGRKYTILSCSRVKVDNWFGPREYLHSFWQKKGCILRYVCPVVKYGILIRIVWRLLVSWEILSTATLCRVKLVENDGWEFGQQCVVRQWIRTATRMVGVKVAHLLVCPGQKHPGVNQHWGQKPVVISEPISTLCGGVARNDDKGRVDIYDTFTKKRSFRTAKAVKEN
jgi:hypothetical protein